MIKRKIERILNSKYFIVFLVLFGVLYVLFNLGRDRESIYSVSDTKFSGIIKKITLKSDKVVLTIDSENESLRCNYSLKDEKLVKEFYQKYKLGYGVEIKGSLDYPLNNTVPNTFNYKEYLYNNKIFYTCKAEEIIVKNDKLNLFYRLKNDIVNRISSFETADYLSMMIIGDKNLLDEETFAKYRQNGVTHLFAISGMHIGLFTAFLLRMLKKLKNYKRYFIVICFIWMYAFMVGFSASVLRACLLFTILSVFKLLDIKVSTLNILLICAFILVLNNYLIIKDISFVYSFTITFGLINSKNILEKHKVLGTSFVATLYSLPITINNFFKVNLLSVIFNLLFVPLVSVIIYPLCLLTFIFRFLEPITKFGIMLLEFLNNICANVDFLYIVIPKMGLVFFAIYYLVLIIGLKKRFYFIGCSLIFMILLSKVKPFLDSNYYVDFIDVGQGDSSIIRSSYNREVIMIDTGGVKSFNDDKEPYHVASNTITYLNSLGIDRIDLIILTHGDFDHLGEAKYITENIEVKAIMINEGEINKEEQAIKSLGIPVVREYNGDLNLRFLNDKDWGNENANSIVSLLQISNKKFLFLGDADKEVERYILANKNLDDVDIIKLGHHGSKTSSDYKFLKKLNPELAIISCGRNNRYRHPSSETINSLKDLEISYKRTDIDGTITLKMSKKNVTINTVPP